MWLFHLVLPLFITNILCDPYDERERLARTIHAMTPIPYSELKKLTFNHITSSESDDITTYDWSLDRSVSTVISLMACPLSVLLNPEDIIYTAIVANTIAHRTKKILITMNPSVYRSLYLSNGGTNIRNQALSIRHNFRSNESRTSTFENNEDMCDPRTQAEWYEMLFLEWAREGNEITLLIKQSNYSDRIIFERFYPYMDFLSYLFYSSVNCVGDRIKNLANIKNDVVFRKAMLQYGDFINVLHNVIELRDRNIVSYVEREEWLVEVTKVENIYPSLGVIRIESMGYASCGNFNSTHKFLFTDVWDSTLPPCPSLIVNETKASKFFAKMKDQSVKCEDIYVSTEQDGISHCPSCLFIDSNFTVNNNNTKVQQCSEQLDGTFIHFFPTYQNRLYNYPANKYILPKWNMTKLYLNLQKYYDVMCTSNCFYFNTHRKQPIKTTKNDLTSAFVFIEDSKVAPQSSKFDTVIFAFVGVAVTLNAIAWTLFCLFYDRNRKILDQMKENRRFS